MPPFCCGGRRCAKDLEEKTNADGGDTTEEQQAKASPITVTEAEKPLTLKFYARHDWPYYRCTDDEIKRMREKFDKKGPEINVPDSQGNFKKYEPKHSTPQPVTENQIYGWYHTRAYPYKPKDRGVFVFPREADPLIKLILETNLMAKQKSQT